jgi:signal transduction histidine kinase
VLFFVAACNDVVKNDPPQIPGNRLNLALRYNEIDSVMYQPIEVFEKHVQIMDSASTNEPAEYKAMAEIGNGVLNVNKATNVLALKHFERALRLLKDSKADSLKARAYAGMGSSYKNTGDYPKAVECLFKALKIYELRNDKQGISFTNGNLAQVYLQKNDSKLAKEYATAATNVLKDNKAQFAYLNSAHTLANIYGMSGNFKKALEIDDEGIRISDSIGSPKLKAPFVDNKANCFMFSGQLDSAYYYFNECLKLDLKTQNKKQIADSYSNLGQLAIFKKDYPEAEAQVLKSISILKEENHQPNLYKSYEILVNVYQEWGKPEKQLEAMQTYTGLYKKMMDEKKEAALAEFNVVHETEKKEQIIAQNRIQLLEKEREVKHRNYLIIGISILALFIAITGWLIYRQQKLRNRQQEQEHELMTAISQIETQNKLQEQRLSISRDLHDNIGAQLTFIISSVDNIRYAFDLKNTKLENRLQSINSFTKATIIELRDTIWAMNHSEFTLEDLRIRIYNFLEKAKDAREEIDFQFTIDEDLSQLRLSSITGMNIYRTIQEAINNALKYASASEIAIAIKNQGIPVRITICDNGIGFDPEVTERGNGLGNMQKRMEDIGGSFTLESAVANGTLITIVLDKKPGNNFLR